MFSGILTDAPPDASEAIEALPQNHREALASALSGAVRANGGTWQLVGAALLGLLRPLTSSGRPVLIAIDDIQWADRASVRVIEFALRRLRDRAILVLTSERMAFRSALDSGVLAELEPETLRVGPMAQAELGRLLARRGGDPSARWLARLHADSGGNPFLALEMARAAAASEEPRRTSAPVSRLAISTHLRSLARGHVAALDDEGLEVSIVASAIPRPTVESIVAAMGDAERVRRGLQQAEAAGVLEFRGEAAAFTHPLLAAAVYETAALRDRRSLHARLAQVATDPEERAWHLALAANGHDEAAAEALTAAAELASTRGAPNWRSRCSWRRSI